MVTTVISRLKTKADFPLHPLALTQESLFEKSFNCVFILLSSSFGVSNENLIRLS
jgi:hypothetical protein